MSDIRRLKRALRYETQHNRLGSTQPTEYRTFRLDTNYNFYSYNNFCFSVLYKKIQNAKEIEPNRPVELTSLRPAPAVLRRGIAACRKRFSGIESFTTVMILFTYLIFCYFQAALNQKLKQHRVNGNIS
jgi:hypothetical protein